MNISLDRKSTRLNSSHRCISYAVFCLKKKKTVRRLQFRTGGLHLGYLRRTLAGPVRAPLVRSAPPGDRAGVGGSVRILEFFFLILRRPPKSSLFPYPPLFR